MQKRVNELSVYLDGSGIVIEQKDPLGNHDDRVVITQEQVELLCGWLLDAKHALESQTQEAS